MLKNIKLFLLFISIVLFSYAEAFAEEGNYVPRSENKVKLTWEEVKGVVSYKVMIRDAAGKLIVKEDSDVNFIIVDIAPGNYKLRIGSINKFNKVWSWSDWAELDIKAPELNASGVGSPDSKKASEVEGSKQALKERDESGSEAGKEPVGGKASSVPGIVISVEGNYILPSGKFKDINKNGMGGLLLIEMPNFLFNNFTAGIVSGYWQFTGTADINKSYIIPAFAAAGYNINFSIFALTPRIYAGMSYNYIGYTYTELGEEVVKNISSIEPMAMGGVNLYMNLNSRFSFYIGADYGGIIESRTFFPFVLFGAGLSFRF